MAGRMRRITRGALVAAVLLTQATFAQDNGRELPPVEDPPQLTAMEDQKLGRAIKKLRNSNARKRAEAEAEVLSFGRGALPDLMAATTTDHEGMLEGLHVTMVALVDVRDRVRVAEAMDSERAALRRFAVAAAGKLGTEPLLDACEPRLTDDDALVRLEAALALARNGREEGLGALVDAWVVGRSDEKLAERWNAEILSALSGLAGAGRHAALVARLTPDARLEKEDPRAAAEIRLAAVELLHHIGDEQAVLGLRVALKDNHNLVQQATINAVRDLVEHKPPFQGATFQQIQELERLRALLGTWRGFDDGEQGGRDGR